jgi:hypothetical protein
MNNRPTGGCSSETQSHPINMIMMMMNIIMHAYNLMVKCVPDRFAIRKVPQYSLSLKEK